MKEKHTYHSQLRQEQAQRTREQIIEGLIRTMGKGLGNLSIPAVAQEAGVSVPTVYRYFKTKQELIEALGSYILQKVAQKSDGGKEVKPPESPADLEALPQKLFSMYEGLDEALRASAVSELSFEIRKDFLEQRLQMIDQALDPVAANFSDEDRIHLRRMVFLLTTTGIVRMFKDYLDLSGDEAARTVAWAIHTLTHASSPTEREIE